MTHVLVTGPITGSVTLADGTDIDVTPAQILLDTPEQVREVCDLIGRRHEAEGHPGHDEQHPFTHTHTTLES